MVKNSTLFISVDLFGDDGEISIEDPASLSLQGILPDPLLTDVRDEVVRHILEYARSLNTNKPVSIC
ncbi:MAG: hypothetical protein U0T82_06815 [Bacteroidales bacterium]